jgi:purine-binding chemotaxis protein CheW
LASTVSQPDITPHQLLLFRLAERICGIELATVREILPSRAATRLPGAPSYVRGIANVRGTVVTVMDLVERLCGHPARADGSLMLVEHGERVIGVVVDEVLEARPLPADGWETPVGDVLPDGVVYAMGELDDQVVLLLDIRGLLTHVLV